MKTALICHEDAALDHQVLARWLASFSDFVGMIVLEEKPKRKRRRILREIRRVGMWRFLDVVAFRAYYAMFLQRADARWDTEKVMELCKHYREVPASVPILRTDSPNSVAAEEFLRKRQPDLLVARCKVLLKERIFSLPSTGTFVFHPGICPEYRNAHGCFWALANRDMAKVGMTLLRVDSGVDTGPVYGFFSYPYDELSESHWVIQQRVVFENLDALGLRLREIHSGQAVPLETSGHISRSWGQPWLTRYLKWKREARKRQLNESHLNTVSRRSE